MNPNNFASNQLQPTSNNRNPGPSIPQTLRVNNSFAQQQNMENFNGHADPNNLGEEYVIEETTYSEEITINSRSQQSTASRNRVSISFKIWVYCFFIFSPSKLMML